MAIQDGVFTAVGGDDEIMRFADAETRVINLEKRTVIPGLNDSHTHVICGGLHYNMELRWKGVPSVSTRIWTCSPATISRSRPTTARTRHRF